jgi:integrase
MAAPSTNTAFTTMAVHFLRCLIDSSLRGSVFANVPRVSGPRTRLRGAVYGALLLQSGTDIAVLSRQLGHGSLGVTARHYGGVADSLGRDAADRLERLLAQPS